MHIHIGKQIQTLNAKARGIIVGGTIAVGGLAIGAIAIGYVSIGAIAVGFYVRTGYLGYGIGKYIINRKFNL